MGNHSSPDFSPSTATKRWRPSRRFSATLEILDSLKPRAGKATAYICEDYVCRLPTSDPVKVGELLDGELIGVR